MRLLMTAAALNFIAIAPAFALQTTAAPTTATPDDNRLVCRREAMTGSLVGGRRVCRTAAQWREQARIAREQGQNAINRSASGAQRSGS
jgi:hypothetical protein